MKAAALPILLLAALSACLPIPGLFYIGQLSNHDQAIFREAARIEDVETVDWPAPGAWIVMYGSPRHHNGDTWYAIHTVFVRHDPQSVSTNCPINQLKVILYRHEIRHTEGEEHSNNPASVMHNPAPCWPKD